jgi:hypothetical protein
MNRKKFKFFKQIKDVFYGNQGGLQVNAKSGD